MPLGPVSRGPAGARGQATVELLALLPLLALLLTLLWQVVLAGQAAWLTRIAAARAARVVAVAPDDPGGAARRAAAAVLPAPLERRLRVRLVGDGVLVRVGVPPVLGPGRLTTIGARARVAPQR